MWYRASHARRLWQTEHTAGRIREGKNERGSRGGNHLKGCFNSAASSEQLLHELRPSRCESKVLWNTRVT